MEREVRDYLKLTVNGRACKIPKGTGPNETAPSDTLARVLRELLGLTGTKTPCNKGECGACTVIRDGKPILSCSTLAVECEGCSITTIEGVSDPETGGLHPIQQAFLDVDAIQCGMCTPGIVMSAKALLDRNGNPTETQVREALAGNICRCTGYEKYVDGILVAAERMRDSRKQAEQSGSLPEAPGHQSGEFGQQNQKSQQSGGETI